MVKAPYIDKDGLKKGAWSKEEDDKLRAYIVRYGHWNWRLLPKFAGLQRCGKSCRLRWTNYLKPGVKRGDFNQEERDLIAKLHRQLGNKWSAIAAKLGGRTDNDIKNYWQTHIQRSERRSSKSGQQSETSEENKQVRCCRNSEQVSEGSDVSRVNNIIFSRKKDKCEVSSDIFILESSSSNSVGSSNAFEWDLNLSVEQNGFVI